MRFILRILRRITNLVFLGLLLVGAMTFMASRWWGLDFRSVASGSMEPTIPVGSVVAVQPVDPATLRLGYIITFKAPENPNLIVTHRVNKVTGPPEARLFHTKGDANDDPDLELVPASNVLGRVRFHVPYLGYLAQFVRTSQGWLYLVAVPAALVVLMELVNILKVIWTSHEQPSGDLEAVQEPVRGGLPILMTAKRQRKRRERPMFARRSLPVAALFMVLVIALASLGVGYGLWSKTLTISGTVNTGTVDAEFQGIESNDDGQGDVTVTNDPNEGGTWTWNGWVSPMWDWAGNREEKDVGQTTVSGPGTTLEVTLNNAYPSYHPSVAFLVKNLGTIPVKVKSIKLTKVDKNGVETAVDMELETSHVYYVDADSGAVDETFDSGDDFSLHVTTIAVEQQIEPGGQSGDAIPGDLHIHLEQDAEQAPTYYSFEMEIVVAQWNEEP